MAACALATLGACGGPAEGDDAASDADVSTDASMVDAAPDSTQVGPNPDGEPDAATPTPPRPDVLYVADRDTDGAFDLYFAPTDGAAVRVSSNIAVDEYVIPTWSRAARRAVYYVMAVSFGAREAATVDLSAAAPTSTTLNAPLVTYGEVARVRLSPDGRRAIYAAHQEQYGRYDLYLVDLSTGTPSAGVRLNDPVDTLGAGVVEARWSPDGNRIAFETDTGPRQLFVVDVTTTPYEAVPLHDGFTGSGLWESRFEWSPDGRWVTYLAYQDGADVIDLYGVDLAGGTPAPARRLRAPSVDPDHVETFAWSPDGTWLAYRVRTSACQACELAAIRMSGVEPSTPQPVNPALGTDEFVERVLRWAPDSSALAYQVIAGTTTQLHVTAFSSTAVGASNRVNGPIEPGGTVYIAYEDLDAFQWAPDSARLAYVAREHEPYQAHLYVARVVDGVPLSPELASAPLPFPNGVHPYFLWTPDARQLVYLTQHTEVRDSELFVVGVGGAAPVTPAKINAPLVDGGEIPFRGVGHVPFVLLGDSGWVAYAADAEVDDQFELYASHVGDGIPSTPTRISGTMPDGGDVHWLIP